MVEGVDPRNESWAAVDGDGVLLAVVCGKVSG